jgi:hypothetical protein
MDLVPSDPPPKQDDLDAVLGPYLERARAAAPKMTPLTDNPELAKAIAEAAALSVDGNPFGPLAPDPDEVVPAAPESEKAEQASAPLAPMRQHTQPLERVKLKGHTTIKGRAVAPVARLPGEPEQIEPALLAGPVEPAEKKRRSPIAFGIGTGIIVLLLGGWWLRGRSTASTGELNQGPVAMPMSTVEAPAPTQAPAPRQSSTQEVLSTAAPAVEPEATVTSVPSAATRTRAPTSGPRSTPSTRPDEPTNHPIPKPPTSSASGEPTFIE